jgi:hypothetical protein
MRSKFIRYRRETRRSFRSEVINWLIKQYDYKKYLGIGVFKSAHGFDKIEIEYKIGVDPGTEGYSEATHTMTSDEFFEQSNEKFDIVFVDGLHHSEQVYKDIINSLNILNEGGTIVCHDMNPQQELHQRVPRESEYWNGDCWKAFVQLRMERSDLEMSVIDADMGLGIVRWGSQEKLKVDELVYKNLDKNRDEWLNLVSVGEFYTSCDGEVKC